MALEITGKLVKVLAEVTGTGKNGNWIKQEFVIETMEQYPKKVCCSAWGDKVATIKSLQPGTQVKVSFNIESREYNERWYTDLRAWKIETLSGSIDNPPDQKENFPGDVSSFTADNGGSDDLPFFKIEMLINLKKIVFIALLAVLLESCKSGKNTTASTASPVEKPKKEKSTKKASSENKKTEAVIKMARSYIGTPYKYGGTSRAGIDCSAFTCASYKAAQINLPRIANDQSTFGKTVGLNELKSGDLIFFTDKKGNTKITHVGLITEIKSSGSVKFIHASTKAGVVETELFSDYYKPLIIKAVRVL